MLSIDRVAGIFRVPRRLLRQGLPGVGLMTLEHPWSRKRWLRVTVDGVDVTRSCQSSDDREGWALCFVRGEDGRIALTPDRRDVVRQILIGDVRYWRQRAGYRVELGASDG